MGGTSKVCTWVFLLVVLSAQKTDGLRSDGANIEEDDADDQREEQTSEVNQNHLAEEDADTEANHVSEHSNIETREKVVVATDVQSAANATTQMLWDYCPPLRYINGNALSPKLVFVQIVAVDIRGSWGDIFSKSDPFVEFWVGEFGSQKRDGWLFSGNERQWLARTHTADSQTKRWNFGCVFPYHDPDMDRVYVQVMDKDFWSHDIIGVVKDDKKKDGIKIEHFDDQLHEYQLYKPGEDNDSELTISLKVVRYGAKN